MLVISVATDTRNGARARGPEGNLVIYLGHLSIYLSSIYLSSIYPSPIFYYLLLYLSRVSLCSPGWPQPFFLMGLGFELRAWHLQSRCSKA
jgi:hypothetical protein